MSSLMSSKTDVWQGTLALMVLKTLERSKSSLHGYGSVSNRSNEE